ncbi:MAG: glycosyltransferase family 39 protein, partial [Candidatus Promineifilaceae bacterium]
MTKIKNKELLLIILAYCLAGVVYAFATPPLEDSDGYKHYPFVQYVQRNWQLPVLDPENPGLWLQEAAQPPLYYILMALVTSPIDTSDLPEIHQLNPHAFVGDPNQVGNKNLIIHQPEKESFPWTGSVLAIYIIRLASIGLGVGTIVVVFRLGRLLFDDRIALLAAALTAFNPMFLFVSAAVNNDSLAILLGHVGLYLLVRLWLDTPEPRTSWRPYLALGIVLGLGLLTKLNLGGLLGLAGLALAWKAWRLKKAELFFVGGPLVLFPALLVPAAWFWRNWRLYGDLTGLKVFNAVQDAR